MLDMLVETKNLTISEDGKTILGNFHTCLPDESVSALNKSTVWINGQFEVPEYIFGIVDSINRDGEFSITIQKGNWIGVDYDYEQGEYRSKEYRPSNAEKIVKYLQKGIKLAILLHYLNNTPTSCYMLISAIPSMTQ